MTHRVSKLKEYHFIPNKILFSPSILHERDLKFFVILSEFADEFRKIV